MEGKTALGASSPAKPALHIPEPLSTTNAATSSSHILKVYFLIYSTNATEGRSLWNGCVEKSCPFLYLVYQSTNSDWSGPERDWRLPNKVMRNAIFAAIKLRMLEEKKNWLPSKGAIASQCDDLLRALIRQKLKVGEELAS